MAEFDITDYGADPGGSELSTQAIQAALDVAAARGGGTVLVPPGTFLFGTVQLRSHVEVRLSPGATLVASANVEDFRNEPEAVSAPEFVTGYCPFIGLDLEDVTFSGTGTIDFRGREYVDHETPLFLDPFTPAVYEALPDHRRGEYVKTPAKVRPAFMFFFRRCSNVRFADVTIRDASCWTFRFSRCDMVRLDGLNILNDLQVPNCDGVHFTSTTNAMVSNCTMVCGDDCVAITNYGDSGSRSSDITITNCSLVSHSCAVRIGYKGRGTIERVTVSNCTVSRSNRGVGVFSGDGGVVRDIAIGNLAVETRLIGGAWWGKGEPLGFYIIGDEALIENVVVTGLTARAEQGIVIYNDMGSTIRNLRLDSILLELHSSEMGPYAGGLVDLLPRGLIRRKTPPLLVHGAADVTVSGFHVTYGESAMDYIDREPRVEDSVRVVIATV